MEDWREKLSAAFCSELEQLSSEEKPDVNENAKNTLEEQQGKQMVNILLDKRNRKGKKVTLITDLLCDDDVLQDFARELKAYCGVGGSAHGGEVLLQGDVREKVLALLKSKGMKARII